MTQPPDRRFEPRQPANARGLVVAPGLELPCLITDRSPSGMRIRVDRGFALPRALVVVELATAMAVEATVEWNRGLEAGLKTSGGMSLRGLVPSRFAAAREAFRRAGG